MYIWKYMREHTWILILALLAIGFAILFISMYFARLSELNFLATNLGTAFIVSAVATWILSGVRKDMPKIIEKEVAKIHKEIEITKDELTDKLEILAETRICGITHVFQSRRRGDDKFKREFVKTLESVEEGTEVLMMSISLRDFFSLRAEGEYRNTIKSLLERGVRFQILLLDPVSKAAQARALIEERKTVEKRGYVNSELFSVIKQVANNLNSPSDIFEEEALIEKCKKLIEVRFFPYDPTTHLVITDKFTFVEQYHRGGDEEIRKYLEKHNILATCFGGFTPILMLENSALTANLMKSHFKNIWNSDDVQQRDLRKNRYFEQIVSFEEQERASCKLKNSASDSTE